MAIHIDSGWILPTSERILLGEKLHSDIVILFMTGLLKVSPTLGNYCLKQLKLFKSEYPSTIDITDLIEDFAVFRMRWIKIGNNRGYNDNMTITIADYDFFASAIHRYQDMGYYVNVVKPPKHTYEVIEQREYEKINVKDVISKGDMNLPLE